MKKSLLCILIASAFVAIGCASEFEPSPDVVPCKMDTFKPYCEGSKAFVCENNYTKVMNCKSECLNGTCLDNNNNNSSSCNVADKKCDSNTVLACIEGEWQKQKECPNGCKDGKCIENQNGQCNNGEKRCNKDPAVETCNNNTWVVTEECVISCINATCVDETNNACEQDARRCNDNTVDICMNGTWYELQECENSKCINGACEDVFVCTEGRKQCNNKTPEVCENNEWKPLKPCTHECKDGACIEASPTCPETPCETNETCINGQCILNSTPQYKEGDPCDPSSFTEFCDGKTVVYCNYDTNTIEAVLCDSGWDCAVIKDAFGEGTDYADCFSSKEECLTEGATRSFCQDLTSISKGGTQKCAKADNGKNYYYWDDVDDCKDGEALTKCKDDKTCGNVKWFNDSTSIKIGDPCENNLEGYYKCCEQGTKSCKCNAGKWELFTDCVSSSKTGYCDLAYLEGELSVGCFEPNENCNAESLNKQFVTKCSNALVAYNYACLEGISGKKGLLWLNAFSSMCYNENSAITCKTEGSDPVETSCTGCKETIKDYIYSTICQ